MTPSPLSGTWHARRDPELSVPTFYDRVRVAAGRKNIPTLAQFRDVLAFASLRTAWFRGAYIAKVNRDHTDAVAAAIAAVAGTDKAAVLPRPKRPTFSGYLSFARRAAKGEYDARGNLTDDGIAADKARADAKVKAAKARLATTTWSRDVAGTDEQKLAELLCIADDVAKDIADLTAKVGKAGTDRARKVVTARRNTAIAAVSA